MTIQLLTHYLKGDPFPFHNGHLALSLFQGFGHPGGTYQDGHGNQRWLCMLFDLVGLPVYIFLDSVSLHRAYR